MKTNEELRNDVIEEFKWDPELREVASQIGVAVDDGVVTLSGALATYRKKTSAEAAAQRVAGVEVVACDIAVKVALIGKRTDTEIAEAVRDALRGDSATHKARMKAKVDNGWVHLQGIATSWQEKKNAGDAVEACTGVRGVTNDIIINARREDLEEIARKIMVAFRRSGISDSLSVSTDTSGTKVILQGKAGSRREKTEAENIARTAPGITTVDNRIHVDADSPTMNTKAKGPQ